MVVEYTLTPIDQQRSCNGIALPAGVRLRDLVVIGPPVGGNTTVVGRLRGWPEVGCLDLSQPRWWLDRVLALRPRAVDLALPFLGHAEAMQISDPRALNGRARVDLARIGIPPAKRGLWSTDWRGRYVFELQLPLTEWLGSRQQPLGVRGQRLAGDRAALTAVEWQFEVYWAVAVHLHEAGLGVYVRDAQGTALRQFCELGAWLAPGSLAHLAC